MKRLSTKEHWDEQYAKEEKVEQIAVVVEKKSTSGNNSGLKAKLKKYIRPYAEYYLWDVLYENYLPVGGGLKAIEVGSAPGDFMIAIAERKAYEPYGVEYTEAGAKLNKQNFKLNNYPPENIIHEDFFSDSFQNEYKNYFDVVFSRGFVEHFDNVEEVINQHINILKPGGALVVSVPNFRGMNYFLLKFFNKKMIDIHNLEIMDKKNYAKLFDDAKLDSKFLDYYGGVNFWLFGTRGTLKKIIHKILIRIQPFFDLMFNLLLRGKRPGSSMFFSPYLLSISVKKK